MPTGTHEQTINTALGEILQELGTTWTIRSEHVGRIFESGGRPDILVEHANGWPIVIEAEVSNYRQAEIEAQQRLGNRLVSSAQEIHAAIALVYPPGLRRLQGNRLRVELSNTVIEYVLFSVSSDGSVARFPPTGWLTGRPTELAMLVHRSGIPSWQVEALADELELGVNRAEGSFTAGHPAGSRLGKEIAELLGQVDDDQGQTRKMAMTVLINALVFHSALAEVGL